ncbi:hypothetical protein QU661_07740 [Mogibacterium neglectum]|nr:hypothetical protein [Mogibacterium neglectum]WLD76160.1 hypothetical protein QU661_07740 [Mogibacterium neglectum]
MKNTIEAIKFIFSNEDGDFEPIAVVGTIAATLFIPMLWIFLYALGCE